MKTCRGSHASNEAMQCLSRHLTKRWLTATILNALNYTLNLSGGEMSSVDRSVVCAAVPMMLSQKLFHSGAA